MKAETTALLHLLGEDNVEKIKSAFTEALIDNIQDSVEQRWYVSPPDIEEMLNDMCDSVAKKLVKEYKSKVEQIYRKRFDELLEEIRGMEVEE